MRSVRRSRTPSTATRSAGSSATSASAPTHEMVFTPGAKRSIELAFENARRLNHNYIGTGHLALGILGAEPPPLLPGHDVASLRAALEQAATHDATESRPKVWWTRFDSQDSHLVADARQPRARVLDGREGRYAHQAHRRVPGEAKRTWSWVNAPKTMMDERSLSTLPPDLPAPVDDGAAAHLTGHARCRTSPLHATDGSTRRSRRARGHRRRVRVPAHRAARANRRWSTTGIRSRARAAARRTRARFATCTRSSPRSARACSGCRRRTPRTSARWSNGCTCRSRCSATRSSR